MEKKINGREIKNPSLPSLPQSRNSNARRARRCARVVRLFAHILVIGEAAGRRAFEVVSSAGRRSHGLFGYREFFHEGGDDIV